MLLLSLFSNIREKVIHSLEIWRSSVINHYYQVLGKAIKHYTTKKDIIWASWISQMHPRVAQHSSLSVSSCTWGWRLAATAGCLWLRGKKGWSSIKEMCIRQSRRLSTERATKMDAFYTFKKVFRSTKMHLLWSPFLRCTQILRTRARSKTLNSEGAKFVKEITLQKQKARTRTFC